MDADQLAAPLAVFAVPEPPDPLVAERGVMVARFRGPPSCVIDAWVRGAAAEAGVALAWGYRDGAAEVRALPRDWLRAVPAVERRLPELAAACAAHHARGDAQKWERFA